ncbi:MAG: hypothetical protein WBC44_18555 [Planctomycetaceae bacterium]
MNDTSMSESTLTNLKVIVERAVRPVAGTLPRKKRMREELLAHVTEVFEQERERLGDEAAALAVTEQRFGDPGEVASQLESTVPAYDRLLYLAERLTQERPGEPPRRHAARCALFITIWIAVASAAAMFAVGWIAAETYRLSSMIGLWLLIVVLSWLVAYIFTLLTHAMQRALFGKERRSLARAAGIGGLACLVAAVATFTLHQTVLTNAVTAAEQVRRLAVETPAFLLIPLIVAGIAYLLEQERRYSREWSELTID